MIYKIADSYLTNREPFVHSDETIYCELRKAPTYNVGIVGTFNIDDFTYSFDVLEDGYYKLFTFTKKVRSTDYIDSEVVTTYEKGNIAEETTFPETYIDVKQTGSPKVYKALLNQTDTDAPVATVLENTLGTITYQYNATGDYSIVSDGLFTENKTFILPVYGRETSSGGEIDIVYESANVIKIATTKSDRTDDCLIKFPILIEVYP